MAYLLQKSNTVTQPYHFIVFDTEAYPIEISAEKQTATEDFILLNQHILSFGYAFYFILENGRYVKKDELFFSYRLNDIEEYNGKHRTNCITPQQVFTDFFIKKNIKETTLYLFAHNLSYDIRHVLDEKVLKEWGYKLKVGISENNFIYKYGKKHFDIVLLSSTNYFRTSLKDLGKTFNLKKFDMSFDTPEDKIKSSEQIKYFYDKNYNPDDEAKKYCYRDVEILEKVIINLIDFTKEKCKFSYTIASTSFNIFRHDYYDENILIHHDPEIEQYERLSYYGGRTECFKIGFFKNIYKLDINSMYPDSMLNHDYPIEFLELIKVGSKEKLFQIINERKYLVIANVTVDVKEQKVPYRDEDKLLYPIGIFSSWLCQPEIEILDDNEILEVKEILVYKKAQIFNKFVSHFYELRLKYKSEKNEVMQYFCKIVLNSLYGKFAQKVKKEIRNDLYDGDKFFKSGNGYCDFVDENDYLHHFKFIRYECFEVQNEESSYNSFIPISSFVTSYSRVLLYKMIKLVKPYLIYCDTDSLMLSEQGYLILNSLGYINKNELGKLKIEDFLLEFDCRNLKDYSCKYLNDDKEMITEHKIKGIKKDAVKLAIKNNEDIGLKNIWSINRFLGYNESLRYFNLIVGDINEDKILKRTYEKGILKNGIVEPIYINEKEKEKESIEVKI
jgi:hypothetical protein